LSKSPIQDIFISRYQNQDLSALPLNYQNTITSIMDCRTQKLGGTRVHCNDCENDQFIYCGCGNRHCPRCANIKQLKWNSARESEFVDSVYFHTVFTVPDDLHGIMLKNQKECYNLLFRSVSETMFTLAKDKKYLGGEIGFISLLHTWGSNLSYRPHLHLIVLGVGLNGNQLVTSKHQNFLFPVKVMSKLFRGKFLSGLKKLNLGDPVDYSCLYSKDWVVFCKDSVSGSTHVVEYLGRYANRVAISDARIIRHDEASVTFNYKDYKDNNKVKQMNLSNEEFCRRFLLHTLPKGFRKVRFYGLLSNKNKSAKLEILCRLLHCRRKVNKYAGKNVVEILRMRYGKNSCTCPKCGSDNLSYYRFEPEERNTS